MTDTRHCCTPSHHRPRWRGERFDPGSRFSQPRLATLVRTSGTHHSISAGAGPNFDKTIFMRHFCLILASIDAVSISVGSELGFGLTVQTYMSSSKGVIIPVESRDGFDMVPSPPIVAGQSGLYTGMEHITSGSHPASEPSTMVAFWPGVFFNGIFE